MWTNTPSIEIAQSRARARSPDFCPNAKCLYHQRATAAGLDWFGRHSVKKMDRFPYISPRFRCRRCRRTFSLSFFTLDYRDRKPGMYEPVFELHQGGLSLSHIARRLKVNEDTIRRRKQKMSRWALLELAHDVAKVKIRESVAYDGLENFSHSQYEPNNLNHAVGRETLFIYDFNLAPMNRKGRMSPRQARRKKKLNEDHGPFPRHAIREQSKKIFERLLARAEGKLELHTDNHYAYRDAIKQIKNTTHLTHLITPAKVARNFRNRLFAINHTDILSRQELGAFRRETIAFSKNSVAMLDSFILFAAFKNYMRTCFLEPHKRHPSYHVNSPAVELGVRKRVLSFHEMFGTKRTVHQVELCEEWKNQFHRIDPDARRPIRSYSGI